MEPKKPNFLIVGAAKAGTTSLYYYLAQHPEIFMPKWKEPLFMTSGTYSRLSPDDPRREVGYDARVYSLDDYLQLFAEAGDEKMLGEGSATYLYYHEEAIPKIKRHLGDPKIIIMLRNPVKRAFSAYKHLVRDGVESLPFEDFVAQEEKRKEENWDILNMPIANGFYSGQVQAYLENFSNVRVIVFADFRKNTRRVVQETFSFLGVDPAFEPEVERRFNKSVRSRYALVEKFLNKDNFLRRAARPLLRKLMSRDRLSRFRRQVVEKTADTIDVETAARLREVYRPDILRLEKILDRNLAHWLSLGFSACCVF